ncbi:glycosyltransferase family 4 protein [[Bacillus] enclensis]|uniref:glycosyltransferase family 4 protein n=1 Tax=[Bacillus] enclensis TaxID=1402860 RepID=UPI0018DDB373|nr:glycosyltransferase family 4 protein [[Bacillus] enclensis]MBH9967910.1 glycosyltransferase family 4 protein [[Bacillus] enclensis]
MVSNSDRKLRILTFNGTYLPGFKAGGPIRSIANMAERLNNTFEFYILTKDRDFGDVHPYPNIKVDQWNMVRNEMVYYHSPEKATISNMKKIINDLDFDIVYLNGFFSSYTIKYLLLRRLKLIGNFPTIILPRGDLSKGALQLKRLKKKLYMKLSLVLGLYNNLFWQATSDSELQDIKNNFKRNVLIKKVENLSSLPTTFDQKKGDTKKKGYLKIIFLSRITEVKNLKFAIEALRGLEGNIEFNIFGPISDLVYWEECQKLINKLPKNIMVKYHGSVENSKVSRIMKENNVLFLPTFGENYGHVIVEAFITGIPVLISDRTPWRELEKYSVGWDISLNHPEEFKRKLQNLIYLEDEEYSKYKKFTANYVNKFIDTDDKTDDLKKLFYQALQGKF